MRPPKEILADRYRVVALLGKGGMGSVWRGEHLSLGTPVAIKLLAPHLAERATVRARFLLEARAAASLRSKHVVQIFDHGVDEELPYIVMELLRGESLAARLHNRKRLEPRLVARVLADVGRAIARAHKVGIIHRDLKPDNIFLAEPEETTNSEASSDDDQFIVKVVDFGIAKVLEESALGNDVSTDTGSMLGTPFYMSPEQARGVKSVDGRADLWAMAVITFECLLGKKPFMADAIGELILAICADAPPVPSTIGEVPAGFDAWFAKATRKSPDARFQTVAELLGALEEVLTPGFRHFDPALGRASLSADTPIKDVLEPTPLELDATVAVAEKQAVSEAVPSPTHDPSTTTIPPTSSRKATHRTPLYAGIAIGMAGSALAIGLYLGQADKTPKPAAPSAVAGSSVAEDAPVASVAAQVSSAPMPASAVVATSVAPATSSAIVRQITLTINCTPKDAIVYRGTDKLGLSNAPIELSWTDQPFDITVKRAGYQSRTLTIQPAEQVAKEVTLLPVPKQDKEVPF